MSEIELPEVGKLYEVRVVDCCVSAEFTARYAGLDVECDPDCDHYNDHLWWDNDVKSQGGSWELVEEEEKTDA